MKSGWKAAQPAATAASASFASTSTIATCMSGSGGSRTTIGPFVVIVQPAGALKLRAAGRRLRRVGGDALGNGRGRRRHRLRRRGCGSGGDRGARAVLLDRQLALPAPLVPRAVVQARLVAEALGREVHDAGLLPDVAIAHDGVARFDARGRQQPRRVGGALHPVVVGDEGVERQALRAWDVAGARHRARLGAEEEPRVARVDERDAGRAEIRLHVFEIDHELGMRPGRDLPGLPLDGRRGVVHRRDDRSALGFPRRHAPVENGGPRAEAGRIEAEVDARGRRDPVLREVDDDARVVADAVALELRAELVGRKELEDESALGAREREVLRVHGDRAGNVLLLEVGGHPDVQEDEVLLAPVLGEPVGRHEHVVRGRERRGREEDEAGEDSLHGTSRGGAGVFHETYGSVTTSVSGDGPRC